QPERRQHAGLARGHSFAAPQDGLALADISAGKGNIGSWRQGTADRERSSVAVRILDHDDSVGAAGEHTAGGDDGRGAGADRDGRFDAGGENLRVEAEEAGTLLTGTEGVLGAEGKAVHVGAVEARDVDGSDNVDGQNAAKRVIQPEALRFECREIEGGAE